MENSRIYRFLQCLSVSRTFHTCITRYENEPGLFNKRRAAQACRKQHGTSKQEIKGQDSKARVRQWCRTKETSCATCGLGGLWQHGDKFMQRSWGNILWPTWPQRWRRRVKLSSEGPARRRLYQAADKVGFLFWAASVRHTGTLRHSLRPDTLHTIKSYLADNHWSYHIIFKCPKLNWLSQKSNDFTWFDAVYVDFSCNFLKLWHPACFIHFYF